MQNIRPEIQENIFLFSKAMALEAVDMVPQLWHNLFGIYQFIFPILEGTALFANA